MEMFSDFRFSVTQSKNVAGNLPHFLGIKFGWIARVADSPKKVWQIRVGLIWWHVVITFNA